jgi:hypothetical protein
MTNGGGESGARSGSGDCPVSSLAGCELKTSPEVVCVKPPETAVAIAPFAAKGCIEHSAAKSLDTPAEPGARSVFTRFPQLSGEQFCFVVIRYGSIE